MNEDFTCQWERKCEICGKIFIPPVADEWVYRIGNHWFCRYNHMREFEKMCEEGTATKHKPNSGRRKEDTPQIRQIIKLMSEGVPATKIAKKFGIDRQLVYYYWRTR